MADLPLRDRAQALFDFILEKTRDRASLQELHQELLNCQQRLSEPMRVAIVGKIKAGKSTMLNALLGEEIVATGTVEATFNINWLKYGPHHTLKVHYKNGKSEDKSFEDLQTLTQRADEHQDYLLSIKYIEVFYPNPILKTFHLIDTPGLDSFYKDDSQNTRDFLNLRGQELTALTQAEADKADAVLYLFSHNFSAGDQAVMEEFQGPSVGRATPINSIGVLTRIDTYWPEFSPENSQQIATRLSNIPQVRSLLYAIKPASGYLALGAKTLRDSEFETLQKLAALPEKSLQSLLRSKARFENKAFPDQLEMPTVSERQKVLHRLERYGIWQACQLIRSGTYDLESLSQELMQASGVSDLSELITSHFGHRAYLIKLRTAIDRLQALCFQQKQKQSGDDLQVVEAVAGKVEALEANSHDFRELDVLRSYYDRKLEFSDSEIHQLLEVTGEYGPACFQRLGMKEQASIDQLLSAAKERMQKWRLRAAVQMGASRSTIEASTVLAHSYERIVYHLQEAHKHLNFWS
ncbi:GTPase, putative [Synechococcus sp. PCC 7335]|uniref:dynamin family protein n=1 Tax=Synechococcus sp. (strain ATCC 29403 / PCC 7335) TaxID=91464 RepID=UPI00017EDD6E|nr:dynamin family protein [Synechococcus sp. PCC 7335]EDX83468.1 GTPase, putative [Synechococcus sp. PCC 7335]